MADEINEITLESNRCLYVNSDSASEIYFSNYYLNQVIGKKTVSDNFKIKFTDNKFMNHTLISDETKPNIDSTIEKINTLNLSEKILNNLNMSLYSKLTYTPPAAAAAAAAAEVAEATQLELNTDIAEEVILSIKDNDTNSIFANIEQVRQYLKYDGFWYRDLPKKYTFEERANTNPVNAAAEAATAEAAAGGKKTTTRRRGKAGHNKHRKSNRRR